MLLGSRLGLRHDEIISSLGKQRRLGAKPVPAPCGGPPAAPAPSTLAVLRRKTRSRRAPPPLLAGPFGLRCFLSVLYFKALW